MSLNLKLADALANAEANAAAALFNNGYLRIYDGTQPATADTAITSQNLLAELRFGATAFGTAAAGVITANPITADSSANNTGTATWFRALQSDGTTPLLDGSVGTSGANCVISQTNITTGDNVACSSFVHTVSE